MDADFNPEAVREALHSRGLTLRAASQQMAYDPAYLSRVLNGKQQPSENLVSALRVLLTPIEEKERRQDYRASFEHLLLHDRRFGGDHVADAGLQVWHAEQGVLDRTVDAEPGRVSAVAELAEVAGWLCYSAGRFAEARQAFIEALTLARQCHDLGMQWFASDMLAMVAISMGRPGEAMRLAEQSLDISSRVPGRVAVMARVRRARALAIADDRTRSLKEMTRAIGDVQESISGLDPEWSRWIKPIELLGHKGEVLLALRQPGAALPYFRKCVEECDDRPEATRRNLSYRIMELEALVATQSWRDCETAVQDMAPLLGLVSAKVLRTRLSATVRALHRTAPTWLKDTTTDVMGTVEQP